MYSGYDTKPPDDEGSILELCGMWTTLHGHYLEVYSGFSGSIFRVKSMGQIELCNDQLDVKPCYCVCKMRFGSFSVVTNIIFAYIPPHACMGL